MDVFNRGTTAGDKAGALFYGTFSATPASQTLTINASTTVAQNLKVQGTGTSYVAGTFGIGTTSPSTQLQVTASASNTTSTLTVGKSGQNKGSCLELYDAAGTAVYAYVAAGASTFSLSANSCK